MTDNLEAIEPFVVAYIYGQELRPKSVPITKEVLKIFRADNYLSANDVLISSQARISPSAIINQHMMEGFGKYAAGSAYRGRSDSLDTGLVKAGGVYDNIDRNTALLTPDSRLFKGTFLRNNAIDFFSGKSDEAKFLKQLFNVPEKGVRELPVGDNDVAKICKGESVGWPLAAALMAAKDYGWTIYFTRQTPVEEFSLAGQGDCPVEAVVFGKVTSKEQALVAATLDTWRIPVVHCDGDVYVPGFAMAAKFGVFGYCVKDAGAFNGRDWSKYYLRFIGGNVCGCYTEGFQDMTLIPSVKTYGLLRGVGTQHSTKVVPFAADADYKDLTFPYLTFVDKTYDEITSQVFAFKFGWTKYLKDYGSLYWSYPASEVPMFVDFGSLPTNLHFGTNKGAIKSTVQFKAGSNYSIIK